MNSRIRHLLVASLVAVAAAIPATAQAGPQPPKVPGDIAVGAGNKVYLVAHGVGVQIYTCDGTSWGPAVPRADLFDKNGKLIIHHFAGPSWQAKDGSTVVGKLESSVTVDPTAIPWLRLSAASTTPGRLGQTTFVQRINTTGGLAPAAATCTPQSAGAVQEIPYTADYVFWKKHGSQ